MRKANHRRHWAQQTLLWGLGLFFAAQLGASLVLDYFAEDLRFPSAARVFRHLRQRPAPQVVFFGSSRVRSLLSDEMERLLSWAAPTTGQPVGVLNAAVPSGDLISTEHLLRRLLLTGAHPRLIVVEVMPEYFNRYNYWYTLHTPRQLRWEDLGEHGIDLTLSWQPFRFLSARLFGLYTHRAAVRSALLGCTGLGLGDEEAIPAAAVPPAPPWAALIDWDQLLQAPQVEMTPQLAAVLAMGHGPQIQLRHYHFGGANVRALERLLLLCQEQDIEVQLFASPITRGYCAKYPVEVEADFQRHLAALQKRFPCRFLDCRDWLGDPLFMDDHHQNAVGALYFSRLLTHRVLIPWHLRHSSTPPASGTLSQLVGDGPALPPGSCK
jgi:hypothetical protein